MATSSRPAITGRGQEMATNANEDLPQNGVALDSQPPLLNDQGRDLVITRSLLTPPSEEESKMEVQEVFDSLESLPPPQENSNIVLRALEFVRRCPGAQEAVRSLVVDGAVWAVCLANEGVRKFLNQTISNDSDFGTLRGTSGLATYITGPNSSSSNVPVVQDCFTYIIHKIILFLQTVGKNLISMLTIMTGSPNYPNGDEHPDKPIGEGHGISPKVFTAQGLIILAIIVILCLVVKRWNLIPKDLRACFTVVF